MVRETKTSVARVTKNRCEQAAADQLSGIRVTATKRHLCSQSTTTRVARFNDMGETESAEKDLEHFAASARAGRRNAVPAIDIAGSDSNAEHLAERLSDMSTYCEGQKINESSPSNTNFEKKPGS